MEASFEGFVRSRGPALLRYAHLLCGDGGRAEDLVQDALVKVHRRWATSADLSAPFAYTRRAVTNEYLSWRRRLTNREVPAAVPDRAVAGPGDGLGERDLVWSVIRDLPRRQRVVIVLRYYEELGDREIAEVLGVAEGTVRSLASRAFATLREHPGLADLQPADVERRIAGDRPTLHAARLVAAAVLVLGVTVGLVAVVGGRSQPVPAGSSATPHPGLDTDVAGATPGIPEEPLVTTGECSGLQVRLTEPTDSGRTSMLRPVVPGPDNRWTTDGNELIYLEAQGPCVNRLSYDVIEPDGADAVEGPTGDAGQRFVDGLGRLITHTEAPAKVRVEIVLGCAPGDACGLSRVVIAAITLSVTEPDPPLTTRQPTSLPDRVRSTVYSTENGTVTSTVVQGPAPTETATVTETVGP